jgi:spore coat protein U-like protein
MTRADDLPYRWLRVLFFLICAASGWDEARACTISTPATIDLGSMASFDVAVAHPNAGSGGSGLACSGILGLLSSQFIFLSVDSQSAALVNSNGDSIPFQVMTLPGSVPLTSGSTSDNLAGASLLSLGGSSGEIQLFVNLGAAGNVSSGTYTGSLKLRWHYAVCTVISAAGICVGGWTVSPGITQGCLLGLCTLNQGTLPGSGTAVDITITVDITRDCRFDADDVDFGGSPFAESFAPVTGELRVTCTKGTTYTVGLSNGNYFANGRRRMASGANRLEYDLFHPGGLRWDDQAQRAMQPVPAQGNVPESFVYEARVYEDQATPPVGSYQDQLIIDVSF